MKFVAAMFGLAVLAGCTTTEDANKAIQSKWIGKPGDQFFSQYGMPASSFTLDSGGTIYRWWGGQATREIPAQYRTVNTGSEVGSDGFTKSQTTTTVTQPNDNTTVTETTTTSMSIGGNTAQQQVLVSPARTETLFCEAQITVDQAGIIQNIEATNDTTGEGLSLSRCAEVFGVRK